MNNQNDLDYIARCPECGHICGWVSVKSPAKDLAKDISGWMRRGFSIERMATDDVRKSPQWQHKDGCSRDPWAKKK